MFYIISAPDPYALISCEGRKVRTPVEKDSLNPKWNTGALFYVRRPQKTRLVVQVSLLKGDLVGLKMFRSTWGRIILFFLRRGRAGIGGGGAVAL